MKIDYNAIKRCIIKACKQESEIALDFKVNADKLNASVQELGLTFVDNFTTSRPVVSADIPLISEYFKKQKLSWFNRSRQFVTLTFVLNKSIDPECVKIIKALHDKDRQKDPDFDRVELLSKLLANYPCYNAVTVAYRSDDPNRLGKNSYTTIIRANVNAINLEEYEYYNPEDDDNNDDDE
jgi:hypothetical protein